MKRFYENADARQGDDGWQVLLDGRPVRTPARAMLILPTQAMAQAIAAEWQAQGETLDPGSMTATGFANAAIDQVAPHRDAFAADVARYAQGDLLCYRAEGPAPLVARQTALWDPWLEWARARYDVAFRVTQGIVHVAQPHDTLVRLSSAVTARDHFTLAALSTIVSLTGSLVLGLAIIDAQADPETIWQAAELDAIWQAEQWGEDAQARQLADAHRAQFDAAVSFCRIVAG